jgi:diguanylate cyclase (GGDEF)-like protein
MVSASQLKLSAFPDSPYAAQLKRGFSKLRFDGQLEGEYVRAHLADSRVLIRIACVFSALVAIVRGVEQASSGNFGVLWAIAFVAFASIALASIAWSSSFDRVFLPVARIAVPARNAVIAVYIASAAALGKLETLMILTPLIVGPFFFLGLRFRASLACGVLTLAAFIASAVFFELAPKLTVHAVCFLLITLVACGIAAAHLEKWSRRSFLETRLIAEIAEHDTLTGAKNRRVFDEHVEHLWTRASQGGKAVAVLLVDVDHFKAYNDRYGHQAGDEALRRVAQVLMSFVQGEDSVLARYGGEEFAAVLYDVNATKALECAERMRHAVEELRIEHRGARTPSAVTISVGLAFLEPSRERGPRGALQLADQALYEAKIKGRNRVELKNQAEYKMLVTGVFSLDVKSRAAL